MWRAPLSQLRSSSKGSGGSSGAGLRCAAWPPAGDPEADAKRPAHLLLTAAASRRNGLLPPAPAKEGLYQAHRDMWAVADGMI